MSNLDPEFLFRTLCNDIPNELHRDVFVTGSLAAAYAFKVKLVGQAINTKDADLLVHPAGNVSSAQKIAERLLAIGWRPTKHCRPLAKLPVDTEKLWAIRLMPPASNDYFIEFLNVPVEEQGPLKLWIPVQINGGWYGLPSFKFMGLLAFNRYHSAEGLEYAAPEMMALSNLLSHAVVSDVEIESGEFRGLRRCAKDLGRVLALAFLSGREKTEKWVDRWQYGLEKAFPKSWRKYASEAGAGLREMLADEGVMEEARRTTDYGLLSGMDIGVQELRGIGSRILADAIEPLEQRAA
ncbi:MAG: hypothetical protein ABSB42_09095 [Tepidisphaeraceae bacterium]|jgi:hypothetical protein